MVGRWPRTPPEPSLAGAKDEEEAERQAILDLLDKLDGGQTA